MRCKQRKGLLNLYQFDVEVQLLACHFVVGIKGNGRIITGGHLDRHRLTGGGIQDNILTGTQSFTAGQLTDLHSEDGAGVGISVGLVGGQMNIDALTDFHIGHSLIIAADHHACSTDEFQRLAAFVGRVKDGTVVQGAPVVGFATLAHIGTFDAGYRVASATAAATRATAAAAASIFVAVFMVMVTVYSGGSEFTVQIGSDCCISIALCTGADFNTGIDKGGLSTGTNTAAKQNAHGKAGKKVCQSLVAAAIGIDDLTGNNLTGLNFVQFEVFGVAEVLENFAVSKWNCNSQG